MNKTVIREMCERSLAGTITFPEVVKTLLENGVESYRVDLVQNQKTFFSGRGEAHTETFDLQGPQIAGTFSAEKVVAAIRASQANQIKYPEFLARIMMAGVSNYTAYLTGRRVIYMGRKGNMHVENFPH
jgi:uncharacterized protein YbcV (DUF1398 family)